MFVLLIIKLQKRTIKIRIFNFLHNIKIEFATNVQLKIPKQTFLTSTVYRNILNLFCLLFKSIK